MSLKSWTSLESTRARKMLRKLNMVLHASTKNKCYMNLIHQREFRSVMNAAIDWIKPWMVQQALSCRGLSEEYCNTPKVSRDSEDLKFEAVSRKMKELFPQQYTGRGSNPRAEQNIATFGDSSIDRSYYTTPSLGKESAAQLTIFYNGTVNVYDAFEKQAKAIIRLAGSEISSQQLDSAGFDRRSPPIKPIPISSTITSNPTGEPLPLDPLKNSAPQQVLFQKLNTGLPMARKQSLQRFLQKRKEFRMNRAAPYTFTSIQSMPPKDAVN